MVVQGRYNANRTRSMFDMALFDFARQLQCALWKLLERSTLRNQSLVIYRYWLAFIPKSKLVCWAANRRGGVKVYTHIVESWSFQPEH